MQTTQNFRFLRFSHQNTQTSQIPFQMMLHFIIGALPASSDCQCRVDALGRMQRPIVDHLWVFLLRAEHLSVNKQFNIGESDINSVVMPLVVANLRDFPTPFSRSEDIEIAFGEVATKQQDKAAVTYKEGVVVTIHL